MKQVGQAPRSFRSMRHLVRAWASIAPTLALAALMSGCAFVLPVPTAQHASGSRRNLTTETVKRFTAGVSTVDEVVMTLGEPDEADLNTRRLVYRWARVHLRVIWAAGIPFGEAQVPVGFEAVTVPVWLPDAGGQWTHVREHAITFIFDEHHVLERAESSPGQSTSNSDVFVSTHD